MAAITYIKTEQNYSKYIFNESISHNLQPDRNNESNIKYYWIIYKQLYNRKLKALFIISLTQFTIAFHSLNVVCHSKPSLNIILRNPQLKFYVSPTKLMSFLQICTSNYSLLAIWRINTIACTLKWY